MKDQKQFQLNFKQFLNEIILNLILIKENLEILTYISNNN